MNNEKVYQSDQSILDQQMEVAGWSILLHSLVQFSVTLISDPGINLYALISLYVGYQLIWRNTSVLTFGLILLIVGVIIDVIGLTSMLVLFTEMEKWTELNWRGSFLISYTVGGVFWSLINIYLCWNLRSQLQELRTDMLPTKFVSFFTNNLDVREDGIESTSGPEYSWYLTIFGWIILLFGLWFLFISIKQPPSSLAEIIGSIFTLFWVIFAIIFNFGRRVNICFEFSKIAEIKSFAGLRYASKEMELKVIERDSVEGETELQKVFVEDQSGKRIILAVENQYLMNKTWEKIKKITPVQYLSE